MDIIIIGAARSGTNMLRDLLCELDDLATWPCDEINYIWRYGQKEIEHDQFTPNDATNKNKKYIAKQFDWVREKYNVDNVIEKTCANSLRVDFVNEVIPNAKYIFLFRDPIDVVASAEIRWKAELDIKYLLAKARFIPFADIPYYGSKYLLNRVKKIFNKEKRLSYWGPKYKEFEKDAQRMSAIEISAKQWLESVEQSAQSFRKMPNDKYIALDYNTFVNNPAGELSRILQFLGLEHDEKILKKITANVSNKSIGKGYDSINEKKLDQVYEIVGNKYLEVKSEFL
ncbi:sulfotransferase family protein [Gracilibacillus kekensis]|uniref:Sulfotransferase domain-containing protein n=1 Tax=Gracilibacillus kekensis TaxID=1027249 RepID=A0A1M7K2Q2_9BACI|nr:sulfotransferase [Gracilibacillus kekensis]SHM59559.1 Sulfotransferase domain-containing protein [Gracilibacillus kekensis]